MAYMKITYDKSDYSNLDQVLRHLAALSAEIKSAKEDYSIASGVEHKIERELLLARVDAETERKKLRGLETELEGLMIAVGVVSGKAAEFTDKIYGRGVVNG